MSNRVVITGAGAITPIGNDPETFWHNLLMGKSGAGKVTRFDVTDMPSKISGEVKNFDPTVSIDLKEARRLDLFAQFAIVASEQAFKNAGLTSDSINPKKTGVIIGSGIGGIITLLDNYKILLERGVRKVSPFAIPMMISDIASALVAIRYNLRGPNYCTTSACASGAHAIGEAYRMVHEGVADIMIAGGSEAPIHPLAYSAFCKAKALTTRNDYPTCASRPFDMDRDGFLIAEGAGILIIEKLENARSREAEILAEIIGYKANADAFHITAPHPEGLGAMESMFGAIESANINVEDIDYINAHGTSTLAGDISELKAIKTVFGTNKGKPIINSTKSMVGHLLGAAGAIELIATIMTLKTGIIHASINLENPIPECEGLNITTENITAHPRIAISNSFGFGGHNATIVLKKWEGS